MESNFKISFWLNKPKTNSKKLIPIYLRIHHNYSCFVKATGIFIREKDWDKSKMHIKGASKEVKANNSKLDALKVKVLQIVNQLSVQGKPYNIHTIKDLLNGNAANQVSLMRICNEQLREMRKLRGKDFANSTIQKYENTTQRLRQFIRYKYKRADMFLYELDYNFISGFIAFLKTKFDNNQNTCYKHYQRLSRMIHHAMNKGYLEKFPFQNFKIRMTKKKIQYLTQAEIESIQELKFPSARLEIIRDIFIFCCYSGLAFAEVESLSPEHLTTGMDGDKWLNIHRKKTHKDYQVPLLPKALEILDKYKDHPACLKRGRCLPVPSNVKYNAYLKEIAILAKIPQSKPLVSHLARRTFACTIALANGMNIGVLSKILGHSGIQVTLDSYATVIDQMMLNGVRDLKNKLTPTPQVNKSTIEGIQKDLVEQLLSSCKN